MDLSLKKESGKRYFLPETCLCPAQHLRTEPVVEKADFSFTQPLAVSHFTYPQSHLLAQVCLLVVGQAAKPLFVMSRGDQIRNGVAWDSCWGGKIPEGVCTKMTSLTPGGLGDSLVTRLM